MRYRLVVLTVLLLQVSCSDNGTGPDRRRFDLQFRYGVLGRNELNTFDNTITKDLILDGVATTRLVLLQRELDTLEARLVAIDIFSYPDTFVVQRGDTVLSITPYPSYIVKVRMGTTWKKVIWEDSIVSSDPKATRLRETLEFIRALVQSKPEYNQLPPARGGYM
jgi:hypothetical protein